MATTDYLITPSDIARIVKWFGWRGVGAFLVGIGVAVGVSVVAGPEAGFFVGLLVFWTGAGYSGRIFFACAVILLVAIIGMSVYDPEYEIGDTKVIEQLAIWVFYFMAIGVVKLFIETVSEKELPYRKRRQGKPSTSKDAAKTVKAADEYEKSAAKEVTKKPKQTKAKKTALKPRPINKKFIRPIHPAYAPTKQKRKIKPKGLIQ